MDQSDTKLACKDTTLHNMGDAEKTDKSLDPTTAPYLGQSDTVGQITDEVVLSKDCLPLFPQPVVGDDLDPLNWSSAQTRHSGHCDVSDTTG